MVHCCLAFSRIEVCGIVSKLALQADLWYTRDIKLFDCGSAANTLPQSKRNLSCNRRSRYGNHCILSHPALQALPYPPPSEWRKNTMSARKGTPEYEAWKNSPEYAERNRRISEAKKGKLFSKEARANMSAAQKASYANLTDEEREARRLKNEVGLSKGRVSRKHTEETKAKISANNKGKEPPNKGMPMSDEQKKKVSDAAKGRQISEATRAKLSAINKGRKYPKSYGDAISERLKGHKVSETTRAKIKESRKDQPPTFLGRKHTEESKAKMAVGASKAQKARYAAMSQEDLDALAERRMRSIRQKKSSLEIFVAEQLDASGIPYKPQKHIGRYVVDFFFPDKVLS